jgi:hypothetical protein
MNKKITCLILILAITLSILPTTFAIQTQTPRMIIDEIDARAPAPATTSDLTVSNILFNPTPASAGDAVTITATITNIGSGQSGNTRVNFYSDDTVIATTSIGRLKTDKSVDTSTIYTFVEEGTHTIKVVVDPNNQVAESNEDNNNKLAPLTIGAWQPFDNIAIANIVPSKTSLQPGETITINVEISNLGNQEETAIVTAYVDNLPLGSKTVTIPVGGSLTTVSFSWTAPSVTGSHIVSADASIANQDIDTSDNQKTCTITVATYSYALNIEIDYMPGHEPTSAVLNYMQNYYATRGIKVTYQIATSAVPLDTSVTTRDFWAIEAKYNSGTDSAYGNPNTGKYNLPDKWVLFGTTVSGQPNVVGYCYTTGSSSDLLAGNYIYIADQASDTWAGSDTTIQTGAEATILMHEVGHAIGIAILSSSGSEVYCSDSTCVMSYLNQENAKNINNCHYCVQHWATKNLENYPIQ